jgi:hypothetical protein
MAAGKTASGHTFNVYHSGEVRLTPEPIQTPNQLDMLGQSISLQRLPEEKNADYRARIMNVYVDRASSTETGLINGITRELGLSKYKAMDIEISVSYGRIIIGDTYLRVYTSSSDYTEFDLYTRDSDTYFLSDLVAAIDAISGYSCAIGAAADAHTPSFVLIPYDSKVYVEADALTQITRQVLDNSNIIAGTFKATDSIAFSTLVGSESLVVSQGDYYVDTSTGFVLSYIQPAPGTLCSYWYNETSLEIMASPVALFEFSSPTFKEKIFEQVAQSNGNTESGLPKPEAVDYINELLAAKGMLWGE